MKYKLLLIVWLLASVSFVGLFVYILYRGSNSDTAKLGGQIGTVWGATGAFLIAPARKAVKLWPARRKIFVLSGLVAAAAIVGSYVKIRIDQIDRLQTTFAEIVDVSTKGAPLKQQFMTLTRENPQNLDEYLLRCAELEPVVNDYSASEKQMVNLLFQAQQQIERLKPQGSYGAMLPMLSVMQKLGEKDLEAAKFHLEEIAYSKQLSGMSYKDRVDFFMANIAPDIEQEDKIAQEEIAIMKDAKERGVALPENMLQDAGLN